MRWKGLIRQLREDEPVDGEALPDLPAHAVPFWRELAQSTAADGAPAGETEANRLIEVTEELLGVIQDEIDVPDFWKPSHIPDQERLKGQLFQHLVERDVVPVEEVEPLVERLFDLARANHDRLVSV